MSQPCKPRLISVLVEVVKKLWGYIKRTVARDRIIIKIIIKMENEKKTLDTISIDVEAKTFNKGVLMDGISASATVAKTTPPNLSQVEDWLTLKVETKRREEGCGCGDDDGICGCPKVEVDYHTKILPFV